MIYVVSNSRAEAGPLASVIAALPEAKVVSCPPTGAPPAVDMANALRFFDKELRGARVVIVLGDRYETLAAAQAAMFLRIPVAHIHGGETTTGAFDDALRHSITFLAEQSGGLHFAATEKAADRIAGLRSKNEDADYLDYYDRIYQVGAPGLDGIPCGSATRSAKEVLVCYHPETMATDYGRAQCIAMLTALEQFPEYHPILVDTNTDPGYREIRMVMDTWEHHNQTDGRRIFKLVQCPRDTFIKLMQSSALMIGNSSAGVIEAPWVGLPSVNVGKRQDGREMAASVFQAGDDIAASIRAALAFTGDLRPVYQGGAAEKIARVVREFVK